MYKVRIFRPERTRIDLTTDGCAVYHLRYDIVDYWGEEDATASVIKRACMQRAICEATLASFNKPVDIRKFLKPN